MEKKGLYGWLPVALICVVFSAGCIGGSSQPSIYYVLDSTIEQPLSSPVKVNRSIGVGPIKVAEFLKRPQIVRRQETNVLEINEFHRWGDSLEAQVMGTLVENLSALLDTPEIEAFPWERSFAPTQQVYIDFRRFDGQKNKSVTLEAVWRIIDTKTESVLEARRSSYSVPAASQGVKAYVKALNSALEKLSMEIGQSLVDLM